MNEELSLSFDDLEPSFKVITLGREKVRHILREPSEDVARKFRSFSAKCMKMSNNELTGFDGIGDVQPYLVSLCLFPEGSDIPVSEKLIRQWKSSVVKKLFDLVKEMGELDEIETVEGIDKQIARLQKKREVLSRNESPAKNSQSGTGNTSD